MTYPLKFSLPIPMFSLKSVARSTVQRDPFVVSVDAAKRLPVCRYEVYAHLGEQILQTLFNASQNVRIPDDFLSALCSSWSNSPELFGIVHSAIAKEVQSATKESLLEALMTWRDVSNRTYSSLRQILDQLSVFCGQNPLELAGIQPKEFSKFSLSALTNLESTSDILTIEKLKRKTGIDNSQLATMIREEDINRIACLFDEVETFLDKLGLGPAQQTDVKDIAYRYNTTQAMTRALKLWRQPNPFIATFETLLEILLSLSRGDVALRVCQLITEEVPKHKYS